MPSNQVTADPVRLRDQVAWLADANAPRDYLNRERLFEATERIQIRMGQLGFEVERHDHVVGVTSYPNLVARYGSKKAPTILFVAHIDVCSPFPGADDNASGVAALMELAELMALHKPGWDHTVELAFVSLEEPPYFRTEHMGSVTLAKRMLERDLSLTIVLDCVGYFSDEPDSQSYPIPGMNVLYGNRGDFLVVTGHLTNRSSTQRVKYAMKASELPIHSINAPRALPGVDFSDHLNFWALGLDAVLLSDTAFYRNDHYHQASDTVDTLDFQRLAQVCEGLYYLCESLEK